MENEHLDTILETKSDEFIKSSVENLVPILRESEDFFEDECECDVLDCDDSQTTNFSTFSNPLFKDSTSSDDESSHEELSSIPENVKTLAKGFYPPSLYFLSFNWESSWSISITFRFSVGLQTPDDLSRSRLGFIEKMGVYG
nr:hypothetical protein [Tanacetum cinerariifolium]